MVFIVNIRTASLYPTGKTCDFLNLVRTDNTRTFNGDIPTFKLRIPLFVYPPTAAGGSKQPDKKTALKKSNHAAPAIQLFLTLPPSFMHTSTAQP